MTWRCIILSIIFDIAGKIDIGRKLSKFERVPDLCIGITFAVFRSVGKTPVISERFIKYVSGADICSAESFKRPGGRLSSPVAFFLMISFSWRMTPILLTIRNLNFLIVLRDMPFGLLHVNLHSGMAFSFKVEAILVKNEPKAFAISFGSLNFTPSTSKV
jgi:hypothetical protein